MKHRSAAAACPPRWTPSASVVLSAATVVPTASRISRFLVGQRRQGRCYHRVARAAATRSTGATRKRLRIWAPTGRTPSADGTPPLASMEGLAIEEEGVSGQGFGRKWGVSLGSAWRRPRLGEKRLGQSRDPERRRGGGVVGWRVGGDRSIWISPDRGRRRWWRTEGAGGGGGQGVGMTMGTHYQRTLRVKTLLGQGYGSKKYPWEHK